ncbi:L-glyceraldehyde 3-phosphate reductase [Nocardioides albertanoniae]|uniref:L-glyceraldehyde 3-phosphate reductase n=1 Tax=Nocardioides albertanoniae TaxID=1175486 RepID=A0A543A2V6_9ACTN|nr:L-glyceraldehyde 3-phosphate reductase [Nocardioides albertanoniae]TQL66910.1 L-glyceraldehyde 3-phosphate reductase [Nocardioides albertanoniae]
MTYVPSGSRYDQMTYRRCGNSGLDLPAVSLGLWHNFGDDLAFERQRAILRTAFDAGITHFDLANNYGPPYGSAEENFGRHLREDFAGLRDELVISTKAGWDMWPGPYGKIGGSKKYLISSLDQSLQRMGLDYVDVFYHHRPDPSTPLEETMGALDQIVRSGKALYVGLSSYSSTLTREAVAILNDLGTPLLIHQPSYSILNRWLETDSLLDTLDEVGAGAISFSPLAQGMLTNKYLGGVPDGSRASQEKSLAASTLTPEVLGAIESLNGLAADRGQTLAQMALAWALRDPRMTSVVIGASRPEQVTDCVGALAGPEFTAEELARIDEYAAGTGDAIDLWKRARVEGDHREIFN